MTGETRFMKISANHAPALGLIILVLSQNSYAQALVGDAESELTTQASPSSLSFGKPVNMRFEFGLPLMVMMASSSAMVGEFALDLAINDRLTMGPNFILGHQVDRGQMTFAPTHSPIKETAIYAGAGVFAQYMLNGTILTNGAFVRGQLDMLLERRSRMSADTYYEEDSRSRPGLLSRATVGYKWLVGSNVNLSAGGGIAAMLVEPQMIFVSDAAGTASSTSSRVTPVVLLDAGWQF
jgi:hypothetical protein